MSNKYGAQVEPWTYWGPGSTVSVSVRVNTYPSSSAPAEGVPICQVLVKQLANFFNQAQLEMHL
jgi:hypothetical protein